MMEFKVGERVKIIEPRNTHYGEFGVIIHGRLSTTYPWMVQPDTGEEQQYGEEGLEHIKEAPVKEYTLLKPVSIEALEQAGACERELHRFAFLKAKYGKMRSNPGTRGAFYSNKIVHEKVIEYAKQCNGGIEFLLEQGFIAEKVVRPDLAVDAPVLVRVYAGEWLKRHFKKWDDDGNIVCFQDGDTSWSTATTCASPWGEWKLPEAK